ncbi:phosphatase PAP2 family protein [Pacificibacter marinus]|uniref:PAP2 superfamily protein n=1 Tax=Pacificibacter marinus TaxID=658057 RepID=A0A1Y5SVK4_9RHOB|nr:phosphatase PAP2 family protein [Pacificibacter marinus]SEK84380.1 PAP2 superfamily protein [Pacificibacter marinus]SLN49022.1 PAP2 superfamily protein [Pacificibacter marinus]
MIADKITEIDQTLSAFFMDLRDPFAIKVFSYITAFGDATVITALLISLIVAFATLQRWSAVIAITVAVLGNVATVVVLKSFFARPRPDFAYFIETTGSFPSGHAAISVAFYGTLALTLWRQKMIGLVVAIMAAVIMGCAISLSRLYLVEHYLSDVVAGLLIGAMWGWIGIKVGARQHRDVTSQMLSSNRRRVAILAVIIAVLFAGYTIATYAPPKADSDLGAN